MDADQAEQLLRALEANAVEYAIFGGMALMFHGIGRFTEDIVIFIKPDDDNIVRLRSALEQLFDDPSIEQITADDLLGDYPAIQYIPPDGGFHIDLLTRLGNAFTFSDLTVVRIGFRDFEVSVVDPATLYRMKRDTVRLQDRADAARLLEHFPELGGV